MISSLFDFFKLYFAVVIIIYALKPLFLKYGYAATSLSFASGLLIWFFARYLELSAFVFMLLGLCYVGLRIKKNAKSFFNFSWDRHFLIGWIIIFVISFINLIRFSEMGPISSNPDTLWLGGIISYFKNNSNFFHFSDYHVLGLSYRYHFFYQIFLGSLSAMLGTTAIATAATGNAIPLLITFNVIYTYLTTKFPSVSKPKILYVSLFFIFSFGLLGMLNPFNDSILNTLGLHYFSANLNTTISLLFTLLILIYYVEILALRQVQKFHELFFSGLAAIVLAFFLFWSKAPYFVVLFAAIGIHFLYLFCKKNRLSNQQAVTIFLFLFAGSLLFTLFYLFYYYQTEGSGLNFEYGQLILEAFKRNFKGRIPSSIELKLLGPIYLIFFFGVAPIILFFGCKKFSAINSTQNLFSISIPAFLVAGFFLLFFSHTGFSQLYFGFAGMAVINFVLCLCFCFELQLHQKISLSTKLAFTVVSITIVSFFFKSQFGSLNADEVVEAKACRYVDSLCQVRKKCLVAINEQTMDRFLGYTSEHYRFYRCSANLEQQFLLSGFAYTPKQKVNEQLIQSLQLRNRRVFENNDWQGIDYIIDFKNEIVGRTPIKTFQAGTYKIDIYEN